MTEPRPPADEAALRALADRWEKLAEISMQQYADALRSCATELRIQIAPDTPDPGVET